MPEDLEYIVLIMFYKNLEILQRIIKLNLRLFRNTSKFHYFLLILMNLENLILGNGF